MCLTPPERLQKEAKPQRLPMIPVTFMHPLARNSSRLGQRLQVALGAAAALAAISLSPGSAQAFVVTVNRVQYDVTRFTGTYNANTSKFQTAANGGVMPWWGSSSSNGGATQFAIAVGSSLDFPNQNGTRGRYFAFQAKTNVLYKFLCVSVCSGQPGIDYAAQTSTGPNEPQVWAQATPLAPPAAPVPGPLPLFGAAAAFGFSRKLRKRIKLPPGVLGSSLPLA
jgi:hypothetical protein